MAQSQFDLGGRIALVTGSTQGIGLALARALAAAGAHIVINGRSQPRLDAAERELAQGGARVSSARFDVTDETEIAAAVERIEDSVGPIDILINNAGMQFRAPLDQFPADKWREIFRLNTEAVYLVAQAVARHMIPRRRGKIINICSVQSELGRPGIAPYTASKGAVKMLTKGMCADWARHGIQVNGIAPGYFKTEMNRSLYENPEFTAWVEKRTPAGRWGTVDELGGAAVFLASQASSFVNGHILYVDGGITSVL
jgi:gluconate 5-dehydrogenase